MEPDRLFALKNHYWLGNFVDAIREGSGLSTSDAEQRTLRDVFLYRALIGQGNYDVVLDEIKESTQSMALRAVRLHAQYLKNPDSGETVKAALIAWLAESGEADPILRVIAANIFAKEGDIERALFAVHTSKKTLEIAATTAILLLAINRLDLALTELAWMKKTDEDAPLSRLTAAWTLLATGGPKIEEAGLIFEELIGENGKSQALLNGLAVSLMHQGRYEQAEKHLIDAMEMGKDADTLVNLVTCALHLGKTVQSVDLYLNQLKHLAPKHPVVESLKLLEGAFAAAGHK